MYIYIDNNNGDVIEINKFYDKDTNAVKTNKVYIGKIDNNKKFIPNEFYTNILNKAEINLKLREAIEDIDNLDIQENILKKPIIGIAALIEHNPRNTVFKSHPRHFCNNAFVSKITNSGGIPLIIPFVNAENNELITQIINSIDGLMLPGGNDIDPSLYAETKKKECGCCNLAMDLFHLKLIKEAVKQNKPVIGICRGNQLINVALGGSLIQDIGYLKNNINHMDSKNYEKTTHDIVLNDNTKLIDILGVKQLSINSIHHQVVKQVAPSMKISALCNDGFIEAIESVDDDKFIVGIQWHPETMITNKEIMDRLFKAFTRSCI